MGGTARISGGRVRETDLPALGQPSGPGWKGHGVTLTELIKQVRLIPQNLAKAAKKRQLQAVHNEQEAERLDRIRNPSKYLGK